MVRSLPREKRGVIFEGAQRIQKLNLVPKARSHCLTAGSSTAGNNRDPSVKVNFWSGRVIFEGAQRIQKLNLATKSRSHDRRE